MIPHKNQNHPQPDGQNQKMKQTHQPLTKDPKKGLLKITPLGGLGEVGKNLTVYEYENDIIIVDMGFMFPSDEMLGVDYFIPEI